MRKNYNYRTIKRYIREIKALLPLMRKEEHKYLKTMMQNINDFCFDRDDPISISDLYREFGEPHDVVSSYYLTIDTSILYSHIRLHKFLTLFLYSIFSVLFVFLIYYSIILYQEHKVFMREEVVFIEEEIT